jgi:hypothetical protein
MHSPTLSRGGRPERWSSRSCEHVDNRRVWLTVIAELLRVAPSIPSYHGYLDYSQLLPRCHQYLESRCSF